MMGLRKVVRQIDSTWASGSLISRMIPEMTTRELVAYAARPQVSDLVRHKRVMLYRPRVGA